MQKLQANNRQPLPEDLNAPLPQGRNTRRRLHGGAQGGVNNGLGPEPISSHARDTNVELLNILLDVLVEVSHKDRGPTVLSRQ